MAAEASASARPDTYRRQTLRPLNGLLFILPMLLFFQVGSGYYGTSLLAPRHLHKLLKYFGATAAYLPPLTIVLVLLSQQVLHRPAADRWKIRPNVLAGMFGESILWMIPLIGLSRLAGRLLAHQATSSPAGGWEDVLRRSLLAVGAGIYEEFLFRLVFICLTLLVAVDIFGLKKELFAVVAVVLGALTFSLYHFSGSQLADMSSFPWTEFAFRAAAGVYLGGLFVLRGFGIAVGAHAFYNIYVLVTQV